MEYMEYMKFVWLGVTVLAAVVEAALPALVSIWFVPGGILALLASLLGGSLGLQIGLFLAGSVLALIVTRPLAKRLQKPGPASTNADRVIGATAVVTEDIDNLLGAGRVSVMGNSWAARNERSEVIPAGNKVAVVRIEGVKLIVAQEKGENLC